MKMPCFASFRNEHWIIPAGVLKVNDKMWIGPNSFLFLFFHGTLKIQKYDKTIAYDFECNLYRICKVQNWSLQIFGCIEETNYISTFHLNSDYSFSLPCVYKHLWTWNYSKMILRRTFCLFTDWGYNMWCIYPLLYKCFVSNKVLKTGRYSNNHELLCIYFQYSNHCWYN